ncbi:hypothetical protein ACA086_08480 [Muriicola sp. E247]|uniref:hypothetical protein n=1 Tax=Muriicola sp. E247 TaxID=3242730 RepID=UPI00352622CC
MKILVAIDDSDYSKATVEEFSKLPLPTNTEVQIISVFENLLLVNPRIAPHAGSLGSYSEEAMSNAIKTAEAIVSDASNSRKEKNDALSITTAVVNGLPKSAFL